MKKIPRISETEWEVMKVVWEQAPCSASRIIASLNQRGAAWHPKTVKAFLNRLVGKKALGFKLDGRAYLYHPLVRQSGGALQPMLAHFVASKRLSREEIRELKKLLESRE
jgi:BlaI family penicillinase repressor